MGLGVKFADAFLKVSIDDKQVNKALRNVQRRFDAVGRSAQAVGKAGLGMGLAIAGSLGALAKTFASSGDNLDKMSLRTGVTVEELQQLGFAAEQSGASLEAIEKGMRGMARNLLDAERGLATSTENLEDLGLTVDDFKGKTPAEQFEIFADRIGKIEDPSRQSALAMKIFGRAGSELLPLMKQGGSGIAAMRKEAVDLGIVMSGESASAAASLTDAMNRAWRQSKALGIEIGSAVAGPLTELLSAVGPIIKTVIEWVNTNQNLVAGLAITALVLTALSAGLVSIGILISSVGTVIGALTGLVTLITAGFTMLTTVVGAVVGAVGFVPLAILAVVEGLSYLLGFGSPTIWLFEKIGELASWVAGKLSDVLGSTIGWLVGKLQEFLGWIGKATAGLLGFGDEAEKTAGKTDKLAAAAEAPAIATPAPLIPKFDAPAGNLPALGSVEELSIRQKAEADAEKEAKKRAEANQREAEALKQRADSLADSVLTPAERLTEQLEEFDKIEQEGLLDSETLARLRTKAREEAADAEASSLRDSTREATSIDTSGAFNPAALASLLRGSASPEEDRIANASEETAANTKQIATATTRLATSTKPLITGS